MAMKSATVILTLLCLLSLAGGTLAKTATETDLQDAESLYRSQGPEAAMPQFKHLLEQFAEQGDTVLSARAERFVGESLWRLGEFERARLHLETAMTAQRSVGARLDEAKTLNVIGLLEWDQGNYDQAVANFDIASEISLSAGDPRLAGATMNNKALVFDELGDYDHSLALYRLALERYEGAGFLRGESDTLGNIGGVNLFLGRYREALSFYRRALAISEQLQSASSMSLDHGNLALCYLGLGEIDTAIQHFDKALVLARDAGLRKEQALWQLGKANAMLHKGYYDLGLDLHREALATFEDIGARGLRLDALHDLGRLHLALGDTLSAERYFQEALQEATSIGQHQSITANLLALGDIRFRLEQFGEAAALYGQARNRSEQGGELHFQAVSSLSLSRVYCKLDRFEDAAAEATLAQEIAREIQSPNIEAEARFMQGEVARVQSRLADSLAHFSGARSALGQNPDPGLLWQIHYSTAQVLIGLDRRHEAVVELQAAATLIEGVRERLKEERFKAGYIHDKYQVYIDLVRLQLELGLIEEAFSTAERLRARNFLDQLESGTLFADPAGKQQGAFALRERVRQLQRALDEERELAPPERRQRAIDSFSSELLLAEREYQAWLDDSRASTGVPGADSSAGLHDLQSRLGPDEALVEYVMDEQSVMIFVLRSGGVAAVTEPLGRSHLVSRINLLRELIQDPTSEAWRTPAASLSQVLIGSLLQQNLLQQDVRHLYLVPHGILNYLPYSLLPTNGRAGAPLLMERFTLSFLPAANTLRHPTNSAPDNQGMLALAPARARLRHALDEARNVSALFEPNARLLTGSEATESAFKSQASAYSVLHLSTHGYFNANNPLLSGLELEPDEENDGQLEVHEIIDLPLHARLVTLSACETGLGSGWFNRLPAGDDFVGLARAFLLAGSHSVLATLWEVDDRSTVALMESFYGYLEQTAFEGDLATSLVQAQRALRNSAQYHHPFYWAPFVLVGRNTRPAAPPTKPTRHT